MTSTRSTSLTISSMAETGVAGLIATPGLAPASRTICTTRWMWALDSACTVIMSAPACAISSTYRSGGVTIMCTSRGRVVQRRMACTMAGPKVRVGTNRPSITST